jgi:predicted ATPase
VEQLHVNNFLVIKEAKFDVGKVNIIIGPQANGKSILAKLLYFFREVMSETFLLSVEKQESKQSFIKKIETSFEKYFPKYTWKDKDFEITYFYDDVKYTISKTSTQRTITILVCETTTKMYRRLKNEYKKFSKIETKELYIDKFWNFKRTQIDKNEEISKYFNDSLFIPASRSFFANLQKNIFSFLAENIDIDPFMKEFGSKYELAKKVYSDSPFYERELQNDKSFQKIQKIVEKILNGKYRYKDEKDWIETKGNSINLSNASSGQQESLPMLLILSIFPFLFSQHRAYFIEEPEAHLFPTSQKYIVSLIGIIYNRNQNSVITTHSPYILTALNNLILANDIKNKYGKNKIKNIIDSDECINFDDVKAYTIKNGKLISIIDKEARLIGINIIDSVSDDFNNTFDKLLSIQF